MLPRSDETYAELEKLSGDKVRAICVICKVVSAINQCELHLYFTRKELLDFCIEHGIHMTAYSPLGSSDSPLIKDSHLILILWGVQRGTSVTPKSVTPSRIQENLKDDIVFEQEDMNTLKNMVTEPRRLIIPDN
ncbi:NADP-dependent oxidoreductase domain-containing protein [Phascolomyces articulosus]|uniref:NADP-dependent oxidoreductase domain-containing protein n=1 Tax=Phascolomyces articulosus TaxID=60185 RepID=A0AAD5K1J6_9FUNG|nr:NADP-dependent oxidoreductase domain-containing protein [Phascolomyces articulosus]